MPVQRLQRLQPPAAKVGGIVYNMVSRESAGPCRRSALTHALPTHCWHRKPGCCSQRMHLTAIQNPQLCLCLTARVRPELAPFWASPQVAPEPRSTGEGWGPYSASFRPHEVAVRRMVDDFSADWWARAQVS